MRVGGSSATLDLVAPDIGCNIVGGSHRINNTRPATATPPTRARWRSPIRMAPSPIRRSQRCPHRLVRWNPTTNLPCRLPPRHRTVALGLRPRPPSHRPGDVPLHRLERGPNVGIFPGYYPGGLDIGGSASNPTAILMEPGLYYIGGAGSMGQCSVDLRHPRSTDRWRQLDLQHDGPSGPIAGPVTLNGGTASLNLTRLKELAPFPSTTGSSSTKTRRRRWMSRSTAADHEHPVPGPHLPQPCCGQREQRYDNRRPSDRDHVNTYATTARSTWLRI